MSRLKKIDNLLENRKYDEAIIILEEEIKNNPDYPDLYNRLAIILLIKEHFKKAIKVLQISLKYNPEYLEAHLNLIIIFMELGKYKEAIKHIKFVREKFAQEDFSSTLNRIDKCRALIEKGDIHEEIGMYEEAIDFYRKASEITPKFPDIYFKMAKIYAETGQYDLAFSSLSKALKINPEFEKARIQRGILYFKRGMVKEAKEEWKQALKFNPESKKATNLLKISEKGLNKKND